jgi:para-nitrobenzyl esterase
LQVISGGNVSNIKPAVVATKSGKVEGVINKGLYIFKGIPYTVPPVGKLRWMPPQPVKRWDGVRPAKEYGAIALQPVMAGMGGSSAPDFSVFPQSEDCLFLNIWTPGLDDAKRPVYFWIHGGGYYIGTGGEKSMDDGILARRGDIVVVSINYRLGALGFLNLNEVTGGKIPATGNEGILDEVAALEWVQQNIAAFGGDPDNITISGFSAGSMSTGLLLSLPAARGKFHKALCRSGSVNLVRMVDKSAQVAGQFLDIVNLKGKDVDALRALTGKQMVDAQQKLIAVVNQTEHRSAFEPVIDGKVFTESPMEAIKKGSAKNIPLVAGTSLDEVTFMSAMGPDANMDEAAMKKRLGSIVPEKKIPGFIRAYSEVLKQRGSSVTPATILGSITTDWMMRIPTIRLVEAQAANGAPAYNFIFAHPSAAMNGALGAMHGGDIPFLFGALNKESTGDDDELQKLAVKVQDSTIAFVKTGDPSCKTAGKWPVYGKERQTMMFDRKTGVVAAPYETARSVWDG